MNRTFIRTCSACGAKNRIPARHLADAGRCGSCKAPLAPQAEPLEIDPEGFAAVVQEAKVPVLVDFWASWCGPCRISAPEVRELAREMAGRAVVLKVDTEAHPELAARYNVQSIPYFLVLRGGRVVMERTGAVPRAEMRRWIESAAT